MEITRNHYSIHSSQALIIVLVLLFGLNPIVEANVIPSPIDISINLFTFVMEPYHLTEVNARAAETAKEIIRKKLPAEIKQTKIGNRPQMIAGSSEMQSAETLTDKLIKPNTIDLKYDEMPAYVSGEVADTRSTLNMQSETH